MNIEQRQRYQCYLLEVISKVPLEWQKRLCKGITKELQACKSR
ncbi:MAG: hypothetical protein KatS3mg003_0741 [Candidatus Nitrosocaldaceae archaeon]|nr:MAG: hypothetical protein KatS3mg003_0741 [Candidatus Nitrosocaldaceae archaeon]